ncbi:uncharacterized protein [Nicotiana sylvestris]|uniref:uncharacterized protein n=1 Tax=Nicotiana sylvestris TaxID=4096 RepID=UPI00388C4CD0
MDCFAWSHSDMTGIPPEVMTHKLNEDPSYPPVKEKKRKQGTFKNQIKAIEEIPDILSNKKEVQRLTGRITASGRFISKSLEKCFKFFLALKKQDHFEWNEEFQQTLRNLKTYLSNLPLLAKPKAGEKLLRYLAISEVAVSVVLVREEQAREARIQQYLEKVRELVKQFQDWKIRQIPRDENLEADALANLASAADVANDTNASVIHLFHSVLDPDANEYGTVPDDKKKAYGFKGRPLEAGAFKQVREKESQRLYLAEYHMSRFGVPKEIVCDNGPQFIGAQITESFQSWQIKRITSTPYHPVGNGQAESMNKVIINNLKKRLKESKGN